MIGLRPLTAADVPPGRTAIVVLGSGSYAIRDWDDNEYSTTDAIAASRVLEAVRVYKLVQPDWVISSGGKVRAEQFAPATGEAMGRLLRAVGCAGRARRDRHHVSEHARRSRDRRRRCCRS